MSRVNRLYRLRKRPAGALAEGDLEFLEEPVPELAEGQALVRTLYLSLDPTNRLWMSDVRGYMPQVPLGAVNRGVGICEVVESRRQDFPEGAMVVGFPGWQEYCVADDAQLEIPFTVLPDPLPAPLTTFLGVLGHTGLTAYVGMDIGQPQPGETVVVSAAAGATGSVAGQIAKARGARVVGIAGGQAKCDHVVKDLGFDACVDYKAPDWRDQLDRATVDGVDVDFENVGGVIMDHVLMRLNVGARVALCGMISQYNNLGTKEDWQGQLNVHQILMQRATMQGFLVLDHFDRYMEAVGYLAGLMAEGKLVYDETIVDGLENAVTAYNQLYSGANMGKLLIRVTEPATN